MSEIAEAVHITERYAYRLLGDLQRSGYVLRSRRGRRNEYRVDPEAALGDPLVEDRPLRELLPLIASDATAPSLPEPSRAEAGSPVRRRMNERSLVRLRIRS